MKTLADVLGVQDPEKPEQTPAPFEFKDAASFFRALLNSPEYRESLFRRIRIDELPPQLERMFYEYAWGKPVTSIEVRDVTDLSNYSNEEIEQRLDTLKQQLRTLTETNRVH